MENEINHRYLTVSTYAKKCEVGPHAIYARIKKSDSGFYKEGEEGYLEQTLLEQAEGVFIDTKKFPPQKMKQGRRLKPKKNAK